MIKTFSSMIDRQQAESIALRGLAFLLSEPRQVERFLAETGIAPDDIRANADSREVMEAALSVLIHDEALLLTFAANAGLQPQDIVEAYRVIAADGSRLQPQSSP